MLKCKPTGCWDCQKELPGPRPTCKQTDHWKRECPQSWRGSGVLPIPRWPGDSSSSPQQDIYIHWGARGGPWRDRYENRFPNWYGSHLLCLNFSHWTSLLQKLYCDQCRQKAEHSWLYWASHLPIWAAVDFAWLSSCASVSYPIPGKGPSELPQGHSLV